VEHLDLDGPGTLVRHVVRPRSLPARPVDVWLPPDVADGDVGARPVLYCQDGQNLFRSQDAFAGVTWSLPTAALAAADATGTPAPVVVGIWNAGERRGQEFLPAEPELRPTGTGHSQLARALAVGRPSADRYRAMLAEDVLPLIEAEHGVSTAPADRTVLGSSMGGLISLYCALTRPELFGGAGCISTNFIIGGAPLVDWFAAQLPPPGQGRLWFDRGTEALDAEYGPTQERMDAALRASALVEGQDWISRVYRGTDHSEGAWAARAPEILTYLLAPRAAG
jgi:enterochelin esterase-like enzyme